jgi:hypothetical protein
MIAIGRQCEHPVEDVPSYDQSASGDFSDVFYLEAELTHMDDVRLTP